MQVLVRYMIIGVTASFETTCGC